MEAATQTVLAPNWRDGAGVPGLRELVPARSLYRRRQRAEHGARSRAGTPTITSGIERVADRQEVLDLLHRNEALAWIR